MKVIREYFTIVLAIILIALLFYINGIRDPYLLYKIEHIISVLFIVAIGYGIYKDIKTRKYKTTIFIVLADIVMAAAIVNLLIVTRKYFNSTDLQSIYLRHMGQLRTKIIFSIGLLARGLLKAKTFEKI